MLFEFDESLFTLPTLHAVTVVCGTILLQLLAVQHSNDVDVVQLATHP
jgi:hypothetical protein